MRGLNTIKILRILVISLYAAFCSILGSCNHEGAVIEKTPLEINIVTSMNKDGSAKTLVALSNIPGYIPDANFNNALIFRNNEATPIDDFLKSANINLFKGKLNESSFNVKSHSGFVLVDDDPLLNIAVDVAGSSLKDSLALFARETEIEIVMTPMDLRVKINKSSFDNLMTEFSSFKLNYIGAASHSNASSHEEQSTQLNWSRQRFEESGLELELTFNPTEDD